MKLLLDEIRSRINKEEYLFNILLLGLRFIRLDEF